MTTMMTTTMRITAQRAPSHVSLRLLTMMSTTTSVRLCSADIVGTRCSVHHRNNCTNNRVW
jgi:hypothetical protein